MKKKGLLLVMLITVIALVMSSCCGTKTQQTYTLTIEASPTAGGDVSFDNINWTDSASQTVDEGTDVDIYARDADDYTFDGWYENGTKINEENPYSIKVNLEREIEARFTEIPNEAPTIEKVAGISGETNIMFLASPKSNVWNCKNPAP